MESLRAEAERPALFFVRLPIYYGWVNLTVAAIAMVGTLPGRTQGLGLITESLLKDLEVDRVLFAQINLKGDELDMYYKVHEALAEKIEKPDLLVYLQASTDTLMQRIAFRDRPYERQMERSYINDLNQAYDSFFAKPFDHTPVLIIESDNLNIIQNPEHLKLIENRIRQSLKLPPFQQSLPLP